MGEKVSRFDFWGATAHIHDTEYFAQEIELADVGLAQPKLLEGFEEVRHSVSHIELRLRRDLQWPVDWA
jgi:hypothetical protein